MDSSGTERLWSVLWGAGCRRAIPDVTAERVWRFAPILALCFIRDELVIAEDVAA